MTKKWGTEEFWGLGAEFDPQWLLTDEQKKIQALIIDLAQKEMRDNAIESEPKNSSGTGETSYEQYPHSA